jgi:hypothetical protein
MKKQIAYNLVVKEVLRQAQGKRKEWEKRLSEV